MNSMLHTTLYAFKCLLGSNIVDQTESAGTKGDFCLFILFLLDTNIFDCHYVLIQIVTKTYK